MSNAGNAEAKALRIGNLVRYFHDESGFNDREIDIEDLAKISKPDSSLREYYEYIPITEEWLVRFGFEETENYFKKQVDKFALGIEKGTYHMPYIPFTKIKYVHQLQNLFFALTGAEL